MMGNMAGERNRGIVERVQRSRFTVPVFAVLLGIALLAVESYAGDVRGGLISLGIMSAAGAVLLFGGRSETIRGLRGDGRDERWAMIDLRATAIAGFAIIIAIIVMFMVELGRGQNGSPYAQLGALGAAAYIAAIVLGRFRS